MAHAFVHEVRVDRKDLVLPTYRLLPGPPDPVSGAEPGSPVGATATADVERAPKASRGPALACVSRLGRAGLVPLGSGLEAARVPVERGDNAPR